MASRPFAVVLVLTLAMSCPAQTPAGDREESDVDLSASFLASDLAIAGRGVPVALNVVNTSADTLSMLSLGSNQLFRYDVEVAIAAGETGRVAFAPWYFGGPLALTGLASPLKPRPLPQQTVLLLHDPADVAAARAADHLMTLVLHYFPRATEDVAPRGLAQLQPARLDELVPSLLTGSSAAGLVVSREQGRMDERRRLAAAAGLDLWSVAADGALTLEYSVPVALRRLAARNHVRSDLFDLSSSDVLSHIPARLFRVRAPQWSFVERAKLLMPAVLAFLLLVCLALLGTHLPGAAKVVAILLIAAGASVWAVVAVQRTKMILVDAVTVTVCDSASGAAYSEHLAAVTALRPGSTRLQFDTVGGTAPRPLMPSDLDRQAYEGLVLHRDLGGKWAVEGLQVAPGTALAFGVGQWEGQAEFPTEDMELRLQSGRAEVRLKKWRQLEEPFLYLGSQAYAMTDAGSGSAYRSFGEAMTVDSVAYSTSAPADTFRRRAMRWVGRNLAARTVTLFFGWEKVPAAAGADAAKVNNHGRLVVWMVGR